MAELPVPLSASELTWPLATPGFQLSTAGAHVDAREAGARLPTEVDELAAHVQQPRGGVVLERPDLVVGRHVEGRVELARRQDVRQPGARHATGHGEVPADEPAAAAVARGHVDLGGRSAGEVREVGIELSSSAVTSIPLPGCPARAEGRSMWAPIGL